MLKRIFTFVALGLLFVPTYDLRAEEGSQDYRKRFRLTCRGRSVASDGLPTSFDLVKTRSKNPNVLDSKICRSSRKIASTSTVHPVCPDGMRLQVDLNHGTMVDRCFKNHLITRNPKCPGNGGIIHQPGRDTCESAHFVYKKPGMIRMKKIVRYQYVYEDEEEDF
ncbi:MAG: hypothetical protein HOE90_16865 [Bacteriovoracaceae bacterium]|jgi:hypothetical protein|nr:hypothetical protein [Bacteriovoracaceae bacterium]